MFGNPSVPWRKYFSFFAWARTTERRERTTINLSDFTRFCTDKFDLRRKAQSLFEPRKRPEIPISRIFLLMVGALALRKQSFHQIDLFARHQGAKKWLGTKRPMVASDATLWRVLPQMNGMEIRDLVSVQGVRRRSGREDEGEAVKTEPFCGTAPPYKRG